MLHDALHHPLAKPVSAVRLEHEHIAKISNRREIADNTSKADLLSRFMINPEAQRMLDRSGDNVSRNSFRPIAIRQEFIDYIYVDTCGIGADAVLSAPVFDWERNLTSVSKVHQPILNGIQHSAVSIQPIIVRNASKPNAEC
jgi:hypothetical protein